MECCDKKIIKKRGNSKGNPIDWDTEFFEKEDNSRNDIVGYRVACTGDSGAGLVVKTAIGPKIAEPFKYILAAIITQASFDTFLNKATGEEEGVPCGAYIKRTANDGKIEILREQGEGQSTTWPEIFNWIKDIAETK